MDVSGSVQGRFGFEKEAAIGFLQHIIRPGYDRAFVVGFNKESHLTQDFTDNVPAACRRRAALEQWRRHGDLRRDL